MKTKKIWSLSVMATVLFLLVTRAHAGAGPWVAAVPEVDGGTAASALGVLIGVITLAAERLRRR